MRPAPFRVSRGSHPALAISSLAGLACAAEGVRDIDESATTAGLLPGPPPSQGSGSTSGVEPADSTNTEDRRTSGAGPVVTSSTTGFEMGSRDTAAVPPPVFDVGTVPDVGTAEPRPEWLVHISVIDSEIHLFHIDIATAVATDLCVLIDPDTSAPLPGFGTTLTFTRDDRLMFTHRRTHLYEIELPSCHAVEIGPIGYDQVNGISPDEGDDLYGITSSNDLLLRIDAQTGEGVPVGQLGNNWGNLGGTWNEDEQQVYGINALDNALYEINRFTGASTLNTQLALNFGSVGMEYHPLTQQIYVCSNDAHLYRLEDDGSVTDLGDTGLNGCNNLGAPWLPDVPLPAI